MAKKPAKLDANGYRKFGMRDKVAYAAGLFASPLVSLVFSLFAHPHKANANTKTDNNFFMFVFSLCQKRQGLF